MTEAVFFLLAILPWWAICLMPQKNLRYWSLYIYVCGVWGVYYVAFHPAAKAAMFNNFVELGIAFYGLWRFHRVVKCP